MVDADGVRRREAMARLGAGLAATALAPWAQAQTQVQARRPSPSEDKGGPVPPLGTQLDLPEVPMLDGSTFRPEYAQGQVLVLYWWGSWCPFCAVQSPLMEKLWVAQRSRGLRMLGLSLDTKIEEATAYMLKRGYSFPSGWVSPAVAKVLPKPKGLPVTYVRGRDGRLLMAEAGQLFPEDVEQIARFV